MRLSGEDFATASRNPAWIADRRIFAALGAGERSSADCARLFRTALDNGERTRPRPQAQPAAGQAPPRQGVTNRTCRRIGRIKSQSAGYALDGPHAAGPKN